MHQPYNLQCQFLVQYDQKHKIVFLKDTGTGKKTITNDAENVYAYYKRIAPDMRIVYQGTDDVWMEIVEQENWTKGICFKPWYGLTWDALTQ